MDKSVIEGIYKRRENLKKNGSFNIAITHNAPLITRPTEAVTNKAKLIKNSDELLDVLSDAEVGILLHGDFHETQHIVATRSLMADKWPLYTAGSGGIIPLGATPFFHLINISFSNSDNCAEVEMNSHEFISDDVIKTDNLRSFVFYLPIAEPIKSSKGIIHVFELPQNRTGCKNKCNTKMIMS